MAAFAATIAHAIAPTIAYPLRGVMGRLYLRWVAARNRKPYVNVEG
jgi:hypothetical protein